MCCQPVGRTLSILTQFASLELSLQAVEHLVPKQTKPDRPKTPPAFRPPAPKVTVDGEALAPKEEVTMEQLHAEIKELRMAMELLQARQA